MDERIASPESVGFSSERLSRIKPVMQAFVDQRGIAGISTMLARRGRVIHFEQVGWQDRESRIPLSPETIYRIYSMTKPVICTAFMTLYEQGRFQLWDPLARFIPEFGKVRVLTKTLSNEFKQLELARPITVKDLLTHTSGLTYHFLEDSPVCDLYRLDLPPDPNQTLEQMTAALTRLPLAFQPGTRWHYSVAIDVIARLIEIISGQPLPRFLGERLFGPLEMTDTGFFVPAESRGRISAMYGHPDVAVTPFSRIVEAWQRGLHGRIDVEKTHPSDNSSSFARGGFGLFSTTRDYMRFAQMLLNRGELGGVRILSPKVADLMHTNHLPAALLPYEVAGAPSPGYGFGLGSRVLLNAAESGVPGSAGEFGWGGAATTYYWIDPKEELIGILMAQFMMGFDTPEKYFQVLAYQAMVG